MQDPDLDTMLNLHEVNSYLPSHWSTDLPTLANPVVHISPTLLRTVLQQVKHWIEPELMPYGWGLYQGERTEENIVELQKRREEDIVDMQKKTEEKREDLQKRREEDREDLKERGEEDEEDLKKIREEDREDLKNSLHAVPGDDKAV